jgi:hypothetical protein
MYCSNCGKTLDAHLNYCNSCGTRVENKTTVIRTGSPMLGIGSIFVGCIGLMAFYPIMRELLHSSADMPAMVMILGAYLLTVFGMFSVLIWQGRKGSTETPFKGNRSSEGFGGSQAFRGINTAQLTEPTRPPASVTDHTTKTLDKVPFNER